MSLWRGDSGRNSAARPALRKRRSECRFCRIQEPASGKSGRLGLALGTSELRQCPSWRRRAGSARVGGDEATASRGEPTAADRGLWRPSAGLRAYARPSVRARNSMAQQTATTAVGLELGSEDRLDEAIGFDGERSRDPPSWRDRNATPGPVVAACCLGAERSSDPGAESPPIEPAIHSEHNRQEGHHPDHAIPHPQQGAVSRNRSMRGIAQVRSAASPRAGRRECNRAASAGAR